MASYSVNDPVPVTPPPTVDLINLTPEQVRALRVLVGNCNADDIDAITGGGSETTDLWVALRAADAKVNHPGGTVYEPFRLKRGGW